MKLSKTKYEQEKRDYWLQKEKKNQKIEGSSSTYKPQLTPRGSSYNTKTDGDKIIFIIYFF